MLEARADSRLPQLIIEDKLSFHDLKSIKVNLEYSYYALLKTKKCFSLIVND